MPKKKAPSLPVPPRAAGPLRPLLTALRKAYPEAACALVFKTPLQLLVATILSAQCTDLRVNQVTLNLFKKYRSPDDFATSPPGELEDDIRSTGFFNNKAKSIRGAATAIRDRFAGEVPQTMEELLTLPGVARKTANVVMGNAFHIPTGIVVDTHVARLSQRLGLTQQKDPVKIERELAAMLPKNTWIDFSHRLILHGRQVCKSRKPACSDCTLAGLCDSAHGF